MQDISVSLTVEDDCQAIKLGAMAGAVTLPYLPDSGLFRTMRDPPPDRQEYQSIDSNTPRSEALGLDRVRDLQ